MARNKYHLHEGVRKPNFNEHYSLIPKMKTLPIIIASFLFLLMLIFVLVLEYTRSDASYPWSQFIYVSNETSYALKNNGNTAAPKSFSYNIVQQERQSACSIPYNDCTIVCLNLDSTDIASNANLLSFSSVSSTCSSNVKLVLNNISFKNGVMSNGWIKEFKYNITQLEIACNALSDLGDRAFADAPFSNLKTLTITSSQIWTLKKHSFINCTIDCFQFRRSTNDGKGITAEEDALGALANNLITLQFNQCINDSETIKNITGRGSIFSKLSTIDMRTNEFSYLFNNSFVNAKNLLSLYLNENDLKVIEKGAFNGIGQIKQLYISNNGLQTLPQGSFDKFTDSTGHIYIQDNPWKCDCDLVWLKNFYENSNHFFTNPFVNFTCYQNGHYLNYKDVDFCPDDTSSTSTSISTKDTTLSSNIDYVTLTTQTTNLPQSSYREIVCSNIAKLIEAYGVNVSSDESWRDPSYIKQRVQISNREIKFDFYQIEDRPDFKVIVDGQIGSDYVLWTNVLNQSDYGCVFNISGFVYLNLEYGKTYTVCLSRYQSVITSTDCTALTVPVEWAERTWIANKQMNCVVGIFITTCVSAIFFTGFCAYIIIRQNPYLIQGNKRVIIVKDKQRASVLPNYYSNQKAFSVYSNSDGYLTPKYRHYSKINAETEKGLDTIIEKFVRDDDFPSRGASPCPDEIYEDIPPPPPPLPQNHPCERRGSNFSPYFYSNL